MEQSTKEAWKRLLDEARRELPDATVRTWLEPAEPIALDDGRFIIGAPDQFAVEWNESKHAGVLARAAERVFRLSRPQPTGDEREHDHHGTAFRARSASRSRRPRRLPDRHDHFALPQPR